VLIAAAVAPATAGAAPTWLQPTPLSSPPRPAGFFTLGAGGPDLGFDRAGNAVLAWQQLDEAGNVATLFTSTRPAGGAYAAPQPIGPMVGSIFGAIDAPALEVQADGRAWLAYADPDGRIRLTTRPPGGSFATPGTEISTGTGNAAVALAVSPNGNAIVAWRDGASAGQARVRPANGTFGPAVPLGATNGNAFEPQVAVNDAGAAAVVWSGSDDIVRARVQTAGGSLAAAPEVPLSAAGGTASGADVAIDPAGRVTAIWQRSNAAPNEIVQSKQSNAAGAFPATADDVSSTGVDGTFPQVEVDAQNTAVAVWTSAGGTVTGASRQSGASFGEPQPISAPDANDVLPARLAIDPAGNALAIWSRLGGDVNVQASRRPRGGVFGPVDDVPKGPASGTTSPAVALDDQGNALVLWSGQDDDTEWTLYGSAYDAAAPSFTAAAVPGTATVGVPVAMTAAAADRWTAPRIGWNFGDGTTTTGGAAQHAFGSAGAFTVTIVATDAVGNSTSTTRTVVVSPPPPTPRIRATVQTLWAVKGRTALLLRLGMRGAPAGARFQLRCSGKRCPFKRKSTTKVRGGRSTLFKKVGVDKAVRKRARKFRAGQQLQVRITAPGQIGKVVKYKLKKGKLPVGKVRCLPLGATKPQRRC
jgi:hypothetical protein